uniref:Odorant binding protein 14 n=1 Tax=Holotrichia oblita TaxID=644536 RepID=A0A3Q8SM77_HOLOL|nr:odorant binding protein 14 [Holotrichia oblita]
MVYEIKPFNPLMQNNFVKYSNIILHCHNMKNIYINYFIVTLINVFLILEYAYAETATDLLRKKLCIRESNVNPSLVANADEGVFAGNRELKCYFRCYYLESGFINDSGEIQTEVIKSKIPQKIDKKIVQQAIDRCKKIKGSDSCETAYEVQKCLYNSKLQI